MPNSLKHLINLLEAVVNVHNMPNNASFKDNCLEYRLDRRLTSYNLDNVDNIKLILAVSGAGKTRMLLELLHSNFGYYFTSKSPQDDFGSGDLLQCQLYCDKYPERTDDTIRLLYFVRAAVCNYLLEKGFNKPWQILLAQLHPVAFFGIDIFKYVFTRFLNKPVFHWPPKVNYFPFVAIDDIQILVESQSLHIMWGTLRPLFSPLFELSKSLGTFPDFLLSGTDMNFEFVKESLEASVMKRGLRTDYIVVSSFHPMSRSDIEIYATQFLQEHQVLEVDEIVSRISAFSLCHGRAGFVAYILDGYLKSKDIDVSIGEFVSVISNVEGSLFPLKFLKRDLDNNVRSLDRLVEGDEYGRVRPDGLLDLILEGKLHFRVTGDYAAAGIRYGLGFAEVFDGVLIQIEIEELAVVECLRYLMPFADIVKAFAQNIAECPKPQMVGYLLEYLVAFALVANHAGETAVNSVQAWQALPYLYFQDSDASQVLFPDHMCGPDVIYKCSKTQTIYIVQVKFVEGISKQESVNACDTTDPDRFYCKRKGNGVLRGYEQMRLKLQESLTQLQRNGYSVQQMLVIHSQGKQTLYTEGALVVTKLSDPEFFNKVGNGIWEFLDSVYFT
ncbi:hypothetical protein BC833DRAFT_615154 [Globomyces pollinis-pini]|nr:hypothetical protein BC833DRAFT_615154 [Globomyces pollinis-pini]